MWRFRRGSKYEWIRILDDRRASSEWRKNRTWLWEGIITDTNRSDKLHLLNSSVCFFIIFLKIYRISNKKNLYTSYTISQRCKSNWKWQTHFTPKKKNFVFLHQMNIYHFVSNFFATIKNIFSENNIIQLGTIKFHINLPIAKKRLFIVKSLIIR